MPDRLWTQLGSWQCLTSCAAVMLALNTAAWFSGLYWLQLLSIPFGLMFGMGGAERDLGITRRREEQR